MGLWKLRLSIGVTLAIIFCLSTLVFTVILSLAGLGFDLLTMGIFVVCFNIVQWLLAPYIVGALYRVKELPQNENPQLHQMVDSLSQKRGIARHKLMIAQIPLPNAFAYGSPISGNRIAVNKAF